MDRVLLSGIAALLIGSILTTLLPSFNLVIDLTNILDGSITLGDLIELIGLILVGVSKPGQEVIRSAYRSTLKALRLSSE